METEWADANGATEKGGSSFSMDTDRDDVRRRTKSTKTFRRWASKKGILVRDAYQNITACSAGGHNKVHFNKMGYWGNTFK